MWLRWQLWCVDARKKTAFILFSTHEYRNKECISSAITQPSSLSSQAKESIESEREREYVSCAHVVSIHAPFRSFIVYIVDIKTTGRSIHAHSLPFIHSFIHSLLTMDFCEAVGGREVFCHLCIIFSRRNNDNNKNQKTNKHVIALDPTAHLNSNGNAV
jgi:hypothetical protein